MSMRQNDVIEPLVSTEWLAAHLADPAVVVLDASYFLPELARDAAAEYAAAHIPGARFLNLAALRDDTSPLPSTFPTASQFLAHMTALGVSPDKHIVLYDDSPHVTSPRAWFVLRHFGFARLSILDGGSAKWRAENRPLESEPVDLQPAPPFPLVERADVRSLAEMKANLDRRTEQVVDARGPGRFSGAEPETRPGLPSGHIPGALNLPYGRLFNPDGSWKRGDALAQAFREAGVDLSRPVVTSCGSGITASVLLFGLHLLGKRDIALYDGSWTEWGSDPSTRKATGTA